MATQSRIKFNPVTKEIEIEGSENFVKTYFDKVQTMLSGAKEAVTAAPSKTKVVKAVKEKPLKVKVAKEKPIKEKPVKDRLIKITRKSKKAPVVAEPIIEPPGKKRRQSKKAPVVIKEEKLGIETKRGEMGKAVLALIQDSKEGITTTELKEKTGLADKQIWAVIDNAKKKGLIKKAKRGLYVGA